ncbi:hypothetical protein [Desulfosediminicola flagellatus]|uniref:hypothetical protein n=1 Tax=Desulfosediminicola flagellatus TaxID=2569541 RepID=UPI0010AB8303|nr:hypothetical protein [Desulfosediminicola flagellatus]
MKIVTKLFCLSACVLLLNGCDWFDDDSVDSSGGSGSSASVAQTGTTSTSSSGAYQTRYHHTHTGGKDPGKSLVLCPGQKIYFEKCTSNGVNIPFHGYDHDLSVPRMTYWNMSYSGKGDIVCTLKGKTYRYPANSTQVNGDC